jgi:hypothetical protein
MCQRACVCVQPCVLLQLSLISNEAALNGAGSKVSLGLEKPDGRRIEAELSRAFTSKERATAVSSLNKGS